MNTRTFLVATASLLLPAGLASAQATTDTTTGAAADTTATAGTGTTATTAGAGEVKLATKEDIKAGATVVDQTGGAVGTVESVTASGAVVSTGAARAEIPFASFGKSDKGLVIAMTKAQLEAAAKGS
jgi:hypothetical protein